MKKKTHKSLLASEVGLPIFPIQPPEKAPKRRLTLFDLSSHYRARTAIESGLKMQHMGFHVFVVGENRSGRMTSTIHLLERAFKKQPPPHDWIYLNNFERAHRPIAFRLPSGMAARLKHKLEEFIMTVHAVFNKTFSDPSYLSQAEKMTTEFEKTIHAEVDNVRDFAITRGFEIEHTVEGFVIKSFPFDAEKLKIPGYHSEAPQGKKSSKAEKSEKKETSDSDEDLQKIRARLNQITTTAHLSGQELAKKLKTYKRTLAKKTITPYFNKFQRPFAPHLRDWMDQFQEDLITHVDDFLIHTREEESTLSPQLIERYSINTLVNNKSAEHPNIIVASNPTIESLFGSIKYRSTPQGGYETNFTMIRRGDLHRANGGILVMRAETLVNNAEMWEMLKVTLNEKKIRIPERHREHGIPILDAPNPKSIPLDVQVFLIGSPLLYYLFFYNDPDFTALFKIKADIMPDLPTNRANLDTYTTLIRQTSEVVAKMGISKKAIEFLMGYSARWVNHRKKLSARFELISDTLSEASTLARQKGAKAISKEHITQALKDRVFRNNLIEDLNYEHISEGQVLIQTHGTSIGQVNGLSVSQYGDHAYGVPNRITAQTYPGKNGVINIERLTQMSGPIQQKGAFILDGLLKGMFSQDFPVSFSCSLTFEQNYGEIEGDSASLAEVLSILSTLANASLRQDLAVTGSLNQLGQVQAVGGVIEKVEGFHRLCRKRGLSGSQGVIIPATNSQNLILMPSVVADIKSKKFTIYPVSTLSEALEILTNCPAGKRLTNGQFSEGSIYQAVHQRLKEYSKLLYQVEK